MLDIAEALGAMYEEVDYESFYEELFPTMSFEEKGIYENGKYNGIAISIRKGEKRPRRYTITDDHEVINELVATDDFCLMSPISYAGKSRKSENARFLYAIAIDLDGVEKLEHLHSLINQYDKGDYFAKNKVWWGLPRPTYLVASGTGIHIYYVLEKPIPLFKNIVKQLEKTKKRLTWQAWTQGASTLVDNIQYESLFQGFRVVGTITKNGGRCRAFRVGDKVTVEYLNQFIPEEYRTTEFTYKTELTLAKAKELYPEWYNKRIVEKRPRASWTCKRDLYDWWKRKIYDGAEQGHRYYCIMTLAAYAVKCNIPREELEEDAFGLIPYLNTKGDLFTEDDVLKALEAYNESYITYPIHAIEARTAIQIPRNKRNGRKQATHIQYMNKIRSFKVELGECTNGGRPPKAEAVREWRQLHPDGKMIDCHNETGMSRDTIRKWWN